MKACIRKGVGEGWGGEGKGGEGRGVKRRGGWERQQRECALETGRLILEGQYCQKQHPDQVKHGQEKIGFKS